MSLQRQGVSIWWQERSGLKLSGLESHVRTLMRMADLPDYIIVHIAGNDIGNVRLGYLYFFLLKDFYLGFHGKCLEHALYGHKSYHACIGVIQIITGQWKDAGQDSTAQLVPWLQNVVGVTLDTLILELAIRFLRLMVSTLPKLGIGFF